MKKVDPYIKYVSNKQYWDTFFSPHFNFDWTDSEENMLALNMLALNMLALNMLAKILWHSFTEEQKKSFYLSQACWYAERTGIEIK